MGDQPGQVPARPVMTLDRYRQLASRLPEPTLAQIEAFAAYLRYAKSWYKHLPILPPGRPFHIYLDPGAGMTRVVRTDGHFGVVDQADKERNHWPSSAAEDERQRFGFLAAAVRYPRRVLQPHDIPSLFDPDLGIDVHLPEEAQEAGRVDISGLIHPLGTRPQMILLQQQHRAIVWPEESGGQQQAAKILERCRELVERPEAALRPPDGVELDHETRWAMTWCDWTLYQLLATERQRQYDALVKAAVRAVAFARGG